MVKILKRILEATEQEWERKTNDNLCTLYNDTDQFYENKTSSMTWSLRTNSKQTNGKKKRGRPRKYWVEEKEDQKKEQIQDWRRKATNQ